MKQLLAVCCMAISGCLASCTASLESPSKALAFSNPQASMSKNWFGTKVTIGTNATGNADITYDPNTGFFHLNGTFSSDPAGVVLAETERAKVAMPLALQNSNNQTQINMASIAAQQAVWEKGFETVGAVSGAFLARPSGTSNTRAGLMDDMLSVLMTSGISGDDLIRYLGGLPPQHP